MKKLQTKESGFTIIEVLIVLAIAGLIMLIVFLAVPALQRNSRNTQRRNDASRLLGAVNEWASANRWNLGSGETEIFGNVATIIGNTGSLSAYRMNLLDAANNDVDLGLLASGGSDSNSDPARIKLVMNARCNGSNSAAFRARSAAVLYHIETGGGTAPQCVES